MDANWEFLLQCNGETDWIALGDGRQQQLALMEGHYRLALYRPQAAGVEIEVRLSYSDLKATPPKHRSERRHCRTDDRGLAVIVPPTHFKPGCWDIRCYGDLMAELAGTGWRSFLQLEVSPMLPPLPAVPTPDSEASAESIVESILAEAESVFTSGERRPAEGAPHESEKRSEEFTDSQPQPVPGPQLPAADLLRSRLLDDLDRFLDRAFTRLPTEPQALPDDETLTSPEPAAHPAPTSHPSEPPRLAKAQKAAAPKLPPIPGPRLREQMTRLLQYPELSYVEDSRTQRWEAAIATLPPPPHPPRASLVPPYIEVLGSPHAGHTLRVRVGLPPQSEADAIKLWLLDGRGEFLLDDPKHLTQLADDGHGYREAIVALDIPFGCAVARFEAIALQRETGCYSRKIAIERCVNLPSIRRTEFHT